MKLIDSALEYLDQGFSVIPSNPENKSPLVKWGEFQNRLPTESEVSTWWKQYPKAMISIVTGKVSNLFVIDCDNESATEMIQSKLPTSCVCPVARTPRNGHHFHFQYPKDCEIITKTAVFKHCDVRGQGGCIVCPPSVNSKGCQYTWLDGLELTHETVQAPPEPLLSFMCTLKGAPLINNINNNKHTIGNDDILTTPFANGRRDNDLFTIANGLIKSSVDVRLASEVLRRLILSWGEEVDEKWVNDKIESAVKRFERREKALSDEVREWILSSNGVFLSSDVVKCLQVSSRDERKNLSKIFSRLVDEGIIERYGNKNGCYRRIEYHVEIIDFQNTSLDATLNIKFPFQIENYVKILPKNIIVIAGEPNAGKTAFLLNMVKQNMQDHEVYYLSSEMGSLELRDRLSKFDVPLEQWKCKFIERSSNFADIIKPDAVNIVDFMEVHDDFYKVGGMIKEIFDKLKNGVAIVALQKNSGTDYGLGGMRSLEKPRLYLAMEPGKIKIVKAKNWANPEKNPNGLQCDFSLVAGCRFIQTSGWKKPN